MKPPEESADINYSVEVHDQVQVKKKRRMQQKRCKCIGKTQGVQCGGHYPRQVKNTNSEHCWC